VVRGSGTNCSISPLVSAVDGTRRARRLDDEPCRYPRNQGRTEDVTDAAAFYSAVVFELLCEVGIDDDLDPDVVRMGEKMAVLVTSGISERHKMCVDKSQSVSHHVRLPLP
jgi:hypothetical protein